MPQYVATCRDTRRKDGFVLMHRIAVSSVNPFMERGDGPPDLPVRRRVPYPVPVHSGTMQSRSIQRRREAAGAFFLRAPEAKKKKKRG
ncbi:hypothetical protein PSP6_320010 [Paraburkholderia tropica]|nr:hypothetical protein PSP6_320010 [Paraburkholderia tropica]